MTDKADQMNAKNYQPGDGIRSMKTSRAFRIINYELYAKPNMVIMALGVAAFLGCTAYISYMRHQFHDRGYVSVITAEGKEQFVKKKSKWD